MSITLEYANEILMVGTTGEINVVLLLSIVIWYENCVKCKMMWSYSLRAVMITACVPSQDHRQAEMESGWERRPSVNHGDQSSPAHSVLSSASR